MSRAKSSTRARRPTDIPMIGRMLARRNSWPKLVNWAVDYVADHPMSILGRLAARRLGRPNGAIDTPALGPATDRRARILIGPVNYSAQGRMWAQSLTAVDPTVEAVNLAVDVPGGFGFDADLIVPVPVYHNSRDWQLRQFSAATRFTHVLLEAEEPLFGRLFGRDFAADADALTEDGVSVAFIAHGTDVRLPSAHRTRTRWSPYGDPALYSQRLERLALRNIAAVNQSGRPVFVSTPDLLSDLPSASWCPVVVDPDRWSTPDMTPVLEPLRVVHVPSVALVKGTHLIEPVLQSLHNRGVIDYRAVTGVASERMPSVYAQADVVLDQFRLGSYGVAACEAMAAGKLVLGHVLETVRDRVKASTGLELPVHEATPDTLERELVELAENRERLAEARRNGIDFVRAVHDGRLSARVLLEDWIDVQHSPLPTTDRK